MKNSLDINQILEKVSHFFAKFHAIMFFVLVGGALAAALLVVVSIVGSSGNTDMSATDTVNQTFDEDTMKKIGELRDVSSGLEPLPSGRINPLSDE